MEDVFSTELFCSSFKTRISVSFKSPYNFIKTFYFKDNLKIKRNQFFLIRVKLILP